MKAVIALTGASGAVYFLKLLDRLRHSTVQLEAVSSSNGRKVLLHETGRTWEQVTSDLVTYDEDEMASRISSGSSPTDAFVIVPCSMSTLSHIAYGISQNLIQRAGAVQLKERRKLIVVPRESPYSLVHLKAMTALTEAGGIILPASPGFYHHPETIEDLVNSVVDRILDSIAIPDARIKRWQS